MTASEYRVKNDKLMGDYEKSVREWLAKKAGKDLSEKIPFFRDGVVDPDVWFSPGNNFRPLFIMKEVNIGQEHICQLDDYLKTWGNKHQFDFVTYEFDDVRVGTYQTWIRIAKLAKGLEDTHNGMQICDCQKYDMSFRKNGKKYDGDIDGYKNDTHHCVRTSNADYDEIISKIAVINFKKVGGGKNTKSEISAAAGIFDEHIEEFKELLFKQIELINPTVIIRCGQESLKIISNFRAQTIEALKGNENVLWIDGYHPRCWNKYLENFYNTPIQAYRNYLTSGRLHYIYS